MKNLHGLLAGALVSAIVIGSTITALAISGRMTIEVDPINIQVNGVTFKPTDVNGNEVPVFAYNGTTYAPLRALAEAYGLEVGYDAENNMATVVDPNNIQASQTTSSGDTAMNYQHFKSLCSDIYPDEGYISWSCIISDETVTPRSVEDFLEEAKRLGFIDQLAEELGMANGATIVFIDVSSGRMYPVTTQIQQEH